MSTLSQPENADRNNGAGGHESGESWSLPGEASASQDSADQTSSATTPPPTPRRSGAGAVGADAEPMSPPASAVTAITSLPIPWRRMTLSGVLEATFKTVRFAPAATLGVCATWTLASLALAGVFAAIGFAPFFGLFQSLDAGSSAVVEPRISGVEWVGIIIAGFMAYLVSAVGGLLAVSGPIYATREVFLGRTVGFKEAMGASLRYLGGLVGISLLGAVGYIIVVALLIGLGAAGFLADTVAGVLTVLLSLTLGAVALALAVVAFTYWVPAYIGEHGGVMKALRRSLALGFGRPWFTLGVVILITIITQIVMGIITAPAQIAGAFIDVGDPSAASGAVWAVMLLVGTFQILATCLVSPFIYVALAVMYLDTRMHREGLDLALTAHVDPATSLRDGDSARATLLTP